MTLCSACFLTNPAILGEVGTTRMLRSLFNTSRTVLINVLQILCFEWGQNTQFGKKNFAFCSAYSIHARELPTLCFKLTKELWLFVTDKLSMNFVLAQKICTLIGAAPSVRKADTNLIKFNIGNLPKASMNAYIYLMPVCK